MLTPPPPFTPVPALVVEMDPFFAILVRRALETYGIEARMAYSARAALELAQRECFQMAFVAARLPDAEGITLVAKIRELQLQNIPIIVVGTDDSPAFSKEALAAGASEYVLKPVTVAELKDLAAKWKSS